MKATDIWSRETRFIELDVQVDSPGRLLVRRGFTRLLAISASAKRLAAVASADATMADKLALSDDPNVVSRNNAQVLILSGGAGRYLWRYRALRHADDVAWCPSVSIATLIAVVGLLVNLLLGRYRWKGIVQLTDRARRQPLVVVGTRRRKPRRGARYYIPHALGTMGLLNGLTTTGVRYAVLRWFESLPDVPPGEDVDLLVADDDFQRVRQLLDEGPGIQPCDLYTVTGLPGSDYQKMPYFPSHLAVELLADARPGSAGCRVPSPRHHFLSLAYHALYHKGPASGLPSRDVAAQLTGQPEHDYGTILCQLARRLRIDVPITREDLDAYLADVGWQPPRDMLVRLAARNPWAADQVRRAARTPDDPGLAVFVVRKRGMARNGLARIIAAIERAGLSVVKAKVLTEGESLWAARLIRGGNWGRGPWPVSGGPPAAAIVVYDTEPVCPSPRQRKRFPHLTNARLLLKERVRDAFNRDWPEQLRCNVLHSSDNGHEAIDYIRALMPDAAEEIGRRIVAMRSAYRTDAPVLRRLTRNGRRAKVELIDWHGRPAVRKTFKLHATRFCQREVEAMQRLSGSIREVPTLLAAGRHWLVCSYYDDLLRKRWTEGRLLPLAVARQAIDTLRKVYAAGYALMDAHVGNIVVDRHEGLKLIDLEFLHRYTEQPASFDESYDIAGCPAGFAGDLPEEGCKTYATAWQPVIGLSLESLCHDPTWLQHVKRLGYRIVHQPRLLAARWRGWRHAVRAAWNRFDRQATSGAKHDDQIPLLIRELLMTSSHGDATAPASRDDHPETTADVRAAHEVPIEQRGDLLRPLAQPFATLDRPEFQQLRVPS